MDEWDASDMSGLEDGFSQLSPSPHSPSDHLDDQIMSDWNSDGLDSDSDLFGDLPAGSSNTNSPGPSSLDSDLAESPISVNSQPSLPTSNPYRQQERAGVAGLPGIAAESSHSAQRRNVNLDNFFLPEISPEIIHVHNHHHHHHHGSGMMFSPNGHLIRRGGPAVPMARAPHRNGPLPEGGSSRAARRTNGGGNGGSSRNDEDELIELELEIEQRRAARQQSRRQSRRFSGQPPSLPPHGEQTIIDLTEEPDSPVQQLRALPRPPPPPASRNPRRQMSLNHRTPSLARSDGSILVEPPPVIDLTEDSPDEARSPPRNNHNNHHHHHHGAHGAARQGQNHRHNNHSQSPDVAFMGIFSRLNEMRALDRIHRALPEILQNFGRVGRNQPVDVEVQIIGHNLAPQQPMDNPLQGNPVLFNYAANGFGNRGAASPKPVFVPPPPAREGFTRCTGEDGDDMAVVCAGCDEELKYDPDADEDGRPTKKARTRKDREEHHFWAVTTCGHVYCKRCFDNRTLAGKKGGELLGFQTEGKALYCAVDGCRSDVRQKRAWVGIFL